jgi:chromosome segregation ATPase
MSEEKLDRIEGQLGQLLQIMGGFETRMTSLETRMNDRMDSLETCMNDRMDGLENRMNDRMDSLETRMNDRMSILEGTLAATMRSGFNNLRSSVNDIDADLAKVEQRAEDSARKVRRLNRRLMYIEGRTEENLDDN